MSSRAMLTDNEREALRKPKEKGYQYSYEVKSRVKQRIERLEEDLKVLKETNPELFEELVKSVSEDS